MERRLLAGLIDLAGWLVGLAMSVAGVVALAEVGVLPSLWRSRPVRAVRGRIGRRFSDDPEPATRVRRVLESRPSQFAFYAFGLTIAVWRRNGRGPGYRLLGLRRVDAGTGGPVGIRAAVVRYSVGQSRRALLRFALTPIRRKGAIRAQDAARERRRVIAEHAGDPEALKRAMRSQGPPLRSCLWALPYAVAACAIEAATLSGTEKRSLADRLACTVVIVDRPPTRAPGIGDSKSS
jgi:hypothetical protein